MNVAQISRHTFETCHGIGGQSRNALQKWMLFFVIIVALYSCCCTLFSLLHFVLVLALCSHCCTLFLFLHFVLIVALCSWSRTLILLHLVSMLTFTDWWFLRHHCTEIIVYHSGIWMFCLCVKFIKLIKNITKSIYASLKIEMLVIYILITGIYFVVFINFSSYNWPMEWWG